jgi:TldD protein
VEDLRRHRREPDRAGHHPRRRGHRGPRRRRRRAPAPELSGSGWRLGRRWLRDRPAPRARRTAGRWPRAVELLTAPQCPSGRFTVVLDPSQLYLQVHESCGHPTSSIACSGPRRPTRNELPDDRQARRGFRYGSDLVDIVADATAPGGMGTFGWDDEGVAAQAVRSCATGSSSAT